MQQSKPYTIDFFAWSWPLVKYHLVGWLIYTVLFYGVNQLNSNDTPSVVSILIITPMAMFVMYGIVALLVAASKYKTPIRRWLGGTMLIALFMSITPFATYAYVYWLMRAIGFDIQIQDVPFNLLEFLKNNMLGFARYASYAAVYFAIGIWQKSQQSYFEAKEAGIKQELNLLQIRHEKQEHELAALQMQLSPHLQHALFNKLYGRALHRDAELPAAILLMAEISAYATKATQPSHAIVPVSQELDIIQKLASLTSHSQAAETARHYMETCELQHPVPRLSLVTLFENAVKFADAREGQPPITFRLEIQSSPATLSFTCTNKMGVAARHEATLGTGLANLRRRLQLLFKQHASLHTYKEKGFFHAHLKICYPLRQ